MADALKIYQHRLNDFTEKRAVVCRRINVVSNLRLVTFVAAVAAAFFFYRQDAYLYATAGFLLGIAAFVAFVVRNKTLLEKRNTLDKLITINRNGISRLQNNWQDFQDTGAEFADSEHPYATDLDIFGPQSAFQWIGSAHSFYGRRALAALLRKHPQSVEQIARRQDAVRELAPLIDWRQLCEAITLDPLLSRKPQQVIRWAEEHVFVFKNRILSGVLLSLPVVTLLAAISLTLYYNTVAVASFVYSAHLVLWAILNRKTAPVLQSFEKNAGAFLPFSRLIENMEKQSFTAPALSTLHDQLGGKGKSSGPLKTLASIIAAIEVRHSPMGNFIANVIWLWDIQCVIRAEQWKRAHGAALRLWLETSGEIEALASLSTIHFEHSSWVFPVITDTSPSIDGTEIGHPLLPDDTRITNDFTLDRQNSVAIITGSNMSGKSTFLRTIGINLVLGYAGAPVCAKQMSCSLINVYTSMRIGDNLRNNVSTFYAELLRIKQIVDAVKRKERILFLLDELFRGTNSQDRHDGAVAVVKALKTHHTVGIISTHDLRLSELGERNDGGFCNRHFKEYYVDKQIHFDYKLYPGPSTTRNAMFLIRTIGIPVGEE